MKISKFMYHFFLTHQNSPSCEDTSPRSFLVLSGMSFHSLDLQHQNSHVHHSWLQETFMLCHLSHCGIIILDKMFLRRFSPIIFSNYHAQSVEIWRHYVQFDYLYIACDVWCKTPWEVIRACILSVSFIQSEKDSNISAKL